MHEFARALETQRIRPTRAVVNLDAIAHNLELLKQACPRSAVLGVIKADAYGHGAVPVARRLASEGVDGLCTALPEEGIELRQAGIRVPVLVLGGTFADGAADTIAYGLTPVIHDLEQLARLDEAARGLRNVIYHLKVDTGMSRFGVPVDDVARFLWNARRFSRTRLGGVMSHLAFAEHDAEETQHQVKKFREALATVRRSGYRPRMVHLANSAAALRFPETHLDLVRPGIALYGQTPMQDLADQLEPSMRVQTEIVQLRQLEPGQRVSYEGLFKASKLTTVATLPVGYADGFAGGNGTARPVLIRGQRVPVVGAVCMDACMVDVTSIPGVSIGDEVVLLGSQGDERIDALEIARSVGSVPHEVLTSVSRRVPRSYT